MTATMASTRSLNSSSASILSGSTLAPSISGAGDCIREYTVTSSSRDGTQLDITTSSSTNYSLHIRIHTATPTRSPPQLELHQGPSVSDPLVASARVFPVGRSYRVIIDSAVGHENSTGAWYSDVNANGLGSSYTLTFPGQGKKVTWKRTHEKSLGASRLSNSDYKLVDEGNQEMLAVFISKRFGKEVGKLRICAQLTRDEEVVTLMSALLLQDSIRSKAKLGLPSSAGTTSSFAGVTGGGAGC